MKQVQNTPGSTGKTEEVFRCMKCGTVLGYYEPGSAGTTKCPACREDFRLEFREGCQVLKRIPRREKPAS